MRVLCRILKQLPKTNIFPPWNLQYSVPGRSLSYFRSGEEPAFGKNAQSIVVLVDSQAAIKAPLKCTVTSITVFNCIRNQISYVNKTTSVLPGFLGMQGYVVTK